MDSTTQPPVAGGNTERHEPVAAIDPLSQHIIKRTHAPLPFRTFSGSTIADGSPLQENQTMHAGSDGVMGILKDKSKGVRMLNRFMHHKKKDSPDNKLQTTVEGSEDRPEGADVEAFHEPVDNVEFSPRHPQLPPYIRVRSQGKKERDFNRLFLAQELQLNATTLESNSTLKRTRSAREDNAIWALEFSHDGKYLAAAGQDNVVRIWAVLASREDRRTLEKDEEARANAEGGRLRLSAPVFRDRPYRILLGHEKPVLDLTWSKNNFLLSSSMDKTVRLWHISRNDCLCAFKHNDFVTSIQFHPRDDRFFLAGSLDCKIRLWSIPDKSVAYWNQAPDMITAVAFTPDGKTAIAGCLSGLCLFYETEGMKYNTQLQVKSAHGKNSKGSKITGIQTTHMPVDDPNGDVKVIVTSNDSRIRWYNLRSQSLEMKFKGNQNASGQIHARLNDDARYIICGSEDKKVFIWSAGSVDTDRRDKNPVEYFEAHSSSTTAAVIAPTKTRQLLSNAEDPVYDTCNPPPVMLVSRAEIESIHSSRPPTESGSIQATPATAEGGGTFKKPEASASYLARSTHRDGNIIITASQGVIKVFRQDCAWNKWRPDTTDATSIFSKGARFGVIRHQSSQLTHSSGRSRRSSNATQPGRERVIDWRQSMASNTSLDRVSNAPAHSKDGSRSPQRFAASTSRVVRQPSGASNAPTIAGASDANSFVTAPNDDSPSKTPDERAQLAQPALERQDSGSYWRDAWQNGVLQQFYGSGKTARDDKQQQQDIGRLGVPSISRSVSTRSELTDEMSSGPEEGRSVKAKVHENV